MISSRMERKIAREADGQDFLPKKCRYTHTHTRCIEKGVGQIQTEDERKKGKEGRTGGLKKVIVVGRWEGRKKERKAHLYLYFR